MYKCLRLSLNCLFLQCQEKVPDEETEFRGNQFLDSAKKSRVLVSVNNDSTDQSGQQTSTEADYNVSASARKIGIQSPELEMQSNSNVTGYLFVEMELLGELFTQMICKECGKCCL